MSHPSRSNLGFTLFELVVVMLILAIVASLLTPALRGFGVGRANANMADLIVALARDARTQAISEARTYRLNFDTAGGQVWLTYLPGTSPPAPIVSAGGQQGGAPAPTASTTAPPAVPVVPVSPGSEMGQRFTLDMHVKMQCDTPSSIGGQYLDFRPTGRTDMGRITLTDTLGGKIIVGCLAATEEYHVLTPDEAAR